MTIGFLRKAGPLRIALALFVFLALFILIVEKPGGSSPAKKMESHPLFFPRLNLEEVTHAEISLPGQKDSLALRRGEKEWMAGEETADQKKVEAFLNAIYLLKKEALVSKNPEKQSIFQVDPAFSTHITLWSNSKELANFYVGRPASLRAQYIRLESNREVWESQPPFPPLTFKVP